MNAKRAKRRHFSETTVSYKNSQLELQSNCYDASLHSVNEQIKENVQRKTLYSIYQVIQEEVAGLTEARIQHNHPNSGHFE